MIKHKAQWLLIGCLYLVPYAGNACGQADPIDSPTFCATFKAVAKCHCSESLPDDMCDDMNMLYGFMLDMTPGGTLDEACSMQSDTSVQNCIDDWNCYRNGGKDSQGNSCSGTGRACE